ncbi:MerR family transcriptional regulator [Prescottella subtropica]|uniref:MerR family transcriptional regulator n=1 Tax=Prescottella subtropica TaxID=2545757 RepID=UPI0010F8D003|nr:MerR family transcriptional regulator [Prescottella subtropica]
MRPVDLAREHGLSAQAVRNYEDAGILPPADRSDTGYRLYTPVHAQALRTFLTLRRGHGYRDAAAIMRAVHDGETETVFRLVDAAHVALAAERETRTEVASALGALSGPAPVPVGPFTVGELAHRLGVHAATLRAWENEGILRPERDRATGYRVYGPEAVRDAEIARQLRRGGSPLPRIARFLDTVRDAGGTDELDRFLRAWQERITTRGRNLVAGAAHLDEYLVMCEKDGTR